MKRDEIHALYRREAEREEGEVKAGRLAASTHASVLQAVRTEVHLHVRTSTPEARAREESDRTGQHHKDAWLEADRLCREAGVWDGPPGGAT